MKLTKRKAWCVAPCQRFANFNAWVVPFPKGGVIVSKRLIQFKKENTLDGVLFFGMKRMKTKGFEGGSHFAAAKCFA